MSTPELARAVEAQRERLMSCVHCGFCLPACPTYVRLGHEEDSPRGRLHLMRSVVDGRLDPASDAFRTHLDRCLGCRACEPVCPSGVEYGTLLELARDVGARSRPQGTPTRLLLGVFGGRLTRAAAFGKGRVLRGTGIARLLARLLPARGILGHAKLGMAMLAASAPWPGLTRGSSRRGSEDGRTRGGAAPDGRAPSPRGRVALLEGCVQKGLYRRVNEATARVLEANGYEVVRAPGQECCGALHAHGGALDGARALARVNVDRFEAAGVDWVVVNAAGCGAAMKEYGTLLADDPHAERGAALADRVRDVSELLAEAGPRPGAEMGLRVAWDHPCHLLHAQGLEHEPLGLLRAIPGLEVQVVENAAECCGGAGIYGITHPELGGRIGGDKVEAVRAAGCDVVATPNPGCMMQIGAGLLMVGSGEGVVHPVELLDESYRRAGHYGAGV